MDDLIEEVKRVALGRFDLPVVGPQAGAVKVTSTFLTDREPGEAMRVSIGRVLADRAREKMRDRDPVGLAGMEVDYSDQAECEDLEGRQVSSFTADKRCYKLILQVVMREAQSS